MENKNDGLREKGMLISLAFSPIVIGFLYAVLIQIPFIGTIWQYGAPFILLYFWGWVATVYREKTKNLFRTIFFMNGVGVLLCLLYVWQVLAPQSMQSNTLLFLGQLFTMPLSFLTMWVGLVLEGGTDFQTLTSFTAILSVVLGTIMMLITSFVGFQVGKIMERNRNKSEEERDENEEEIEAVFSDKQLEEDGLNPPR